MSSKILATSLVQLKLHRRSLRLKQWMWIGGLALGGMVSEVAWAGCTVVSALTHSTATCSTTGATFDVGGPEVTAAPAALALCQAACGGGGGDTKDSTPGLTPFSETVLQISAAGEAECTSAENGSTVIITGATAASGKSPIPSNCQLDVSKSDACRGTYQPAEWSTVTVTPKAGCEIRSWSGNEQCRTEAIYQNPQKPFQIFLNQPGISCTVYLVRSEYALEITTEGNGSVTSDPASIACGSDCTKSFKRETKVTLSAKPDDGWQFVGWGENCESSQTNPQTTLYMGRDISCTATFSKIPPPQFMLTVVKTGTGASEGMVTSQDDKIMCGNTCDNSYDQGYAVTLNATANDKAKFKGWTQCTNSLEPQITVTVDAAKTCEASFEAVTTTPPPVVVTPTDKKPQTITIWSFTAEVGKTTALKVTGGGSQNPVKLVGQTTDTCTITDSNVTFVQAGECQIQATQNGNDQYDDAQPVTVTITVTPATTQPTDTTKQNQVITAVSLTNVTGSGTLTAQGGGSNNPLIFASQSEDVCTVNPNHVATFLKTGTCILTVNQAGNSQYNPAPQVTLSFGVPTTPSTPISTCAVLADAPVVNDTCDGKGKVASKTNEFGTNAEVSNIVIDHPVTNQGLLNNITITKEGKIDRGSSKKGTLGGEIHNEGTLCNFILTGHLLAGGTLCGNIRVENVDSMVKDVILAENTTLSGGSVSGKVTCQSAETSILEDLVIKAGTEVTGCKLQNTFEESAVSSEEERYGVFTQTKGKGSGVIRSNPLGKNDKGFNVVELIAVADDNSGFTRWENDNAPECTGRKETVQVLVNDIKTCIAYFYVKSNTGADWANSPLTGENGTLKIHMEGSGGGLVKSESIEENNNGVNKVKLTAVADSHSAFGEWEGENAPECVGTKTEVEVVVEGEKTCTAYFDAVSPEDKQQQKISIDVTPSRAMIGGKLKVKTSGGGSGNPVTLKANSPEVCSLQDDTITLLKEGTCSVTAEQAGNGQYLDADPQTVTLTVRNDKASLIGKVSSDKDSSGQVQTATTLDTLNVSLDLKAAPNDVGQEAEVLLVAELNGQWFKATESGWLAWDKNMANLAALTRVRLSAEAISLPIYQGTLPLVGTVNLYAAYRSGKKVILLEDLQKILTLSITAPPTLETAKATCTQQGGIYFSQQCFTKVPLLSEAGQFSGGVYQFDKPQAGLQTVMSLPCRLGKRIAILGSFQNDYPPGIPAEIVVAFVHGLSSRVYQYNDQGFNELPYIGSNDVPDLDLLSGKAMASLPEKFAGVFFEGELPSKGELYAFFGYRLKNPDGSTQVLHYSKTPLVINVAAESCINTDLELEILPLGTGMGNVFSNELGSEKIVLSALPAADSVLKGWQGDAEGCTPHPTATVTIKPTADKYTCQAIFERKTPLNCDEASATCPVIPQPCQPLPQTTQWILGIGQNSVIQFTNLSSEARSITVNLFDSAGNKIGNSNNILPDELGPLATLQFNATALKDMIGHWSGDASLEVLDAKNLTVVSYINGSALVDSTATHQHRLYNLTADSQIRISNTGNQDIPLSVRLFNKQGELTLVGEKAQDILRNKGVLSAHASERLSISSVPEGSWIEIYPQAVDKRCTGEIQLQHINSNGINVTSADN